LCLTGPKRWTVEDRVERIDVVADAVEPIAGDGSEDSALAWRSPGLPA